MHLACDSREVSLVAENNVIKVHKLNVLVLHKNLFNFTVDELYLDRIVSRIIVQLHVFGYRNFVDVRRR